MPISKEWIPKYIRQKVRFRPGQTPTAEEINMYYNLLIDQGDYNTEYLTFLFEKGMYEVIKDIIMNDIDELNSNMDVINTHFATVRAQLEGHDLEINDHGLKLTDILKRLKAVEERVQALYKNYLLSDTVTGIVYKIDVTNGVLTVKPVGEYSYFIKDTATATVYAFTIYNDRIVYTESVAPEGTVPHAGLVVTDDTDTKKYKFMITNGVPYTDETQDSPTASEGALQIVDDYLLKVREIHFKNGTMYIKEV